MQTRNHSPADPDMLRAWANQVAVDPGDVARSGLCGLEDLVDGSRIIILGEPNHFIHEKVDFRLWWLERLARRYPLVLAEELGWADGRRIATYLQDGDTEHIARASTFGYRGWQRGDRDDMPTGVFAAHNSDYPTERMHTEHLRFYRGVRELGIRSYYGFDIDLAGGVTYENIGPVQEFQNVARVPGESLAAETGRIGENLLRYKDQPGFVDIEEDLRSLQASLHYTALVRDAADFEATRPAMAVREESMKRRVASIIDMAPVNAKVVLMAHAFHLVRDDAAINSAGVVGPGGDRVPSLGHFLGQQRHLPSTAIWMLYASGRDCQPLHNLPRQADYPEAAFNRLAAADRRRILPTRSMPQGAVMVGHMYNAVTEVDLATQADAIDLFPVVKPLDT